MEPMSTIKAEGGRFGTAHTRSYTSFMIMGLQGGLIWFVQQDLADGGPHSLVRALGMESTTWVWVVLIVAYLLTTFSASVVSGIFTQYTGTIYTENRIGYAKSGGTDISGWSGLLSFGLALLVFANVVPAGFLGGFRPFVFIIISTVLSWFLAAVVANKVFRALYGPPHYKLSDIVRTKGKT